MMAAKKGARGATVGLASATPPVLVVLAFVSSGAWWFFTLPPAPIAKALNLVTLALWLAAFGLGLVVFVRPDRRLLWALGAVLVSIGLSFVVGGSHFAVAFYDLYADMPLVQWLAFPVMFLLAAGMRTDRSRLERGLSVVVALGAVFCVILTYQQLTIGVSWVFGSSSYAVTALAALIPVAVWLGSSRRGVARAAWYACAAVIAIALGVVSRSSMGALAVGFALLVSVAVHPVVLGARGRGLRILQVVALSLAGLMVAGLVFVQVPALSGRWVNAEAFAAQRNIVSRVYLWQGAQKMLAARPVLGFGPSGYRVWAVDYLDPNALRFGADQFGNTDPTVYSAQSPHSLIWDIGTRLGVIGLVAFGALLAVWGAVLVPLVRSLDATSGLRAALAAGFVSALFALLVNPAIFAIGLFAPVAAGLAVGPMTDKPSGAEKPTPNRATVWLAVVGLAVILLAGWLFLGEWRAFNARAEAPEVAVVEYAAVLRTTPGNPMALRKLLENRLILASDAEIGAAQAAVDDAPSFIRDYAPNLSNFAAYSLAQAQRTGRTDLSWEQKLLTAAAAKMPPIPSTVAEQLHLAVLSGDAEAVRRALPDAERWGGPYPYTAGYIQAASQLTSSAPQ